MAEKNIKSRIVHKHDTEANWNKATSFKPLLGEIIVYDIDNKYNYERIKIGDGVTTVVNLPFVTASDADISGADYGVTTTGSGSAYIAAVPGIDSLTAGVSFIMVPHVASTSTSPTLNVNNLGAKPIKRRLSSTGVGTQTGYTASWLANGSAFRVVYDGTSWIVESLTKPAAADLSGTVQINKGGTGATDAPTALVNLGAASAADLDALEALVGDKSVSTQIDAAIASKAPNSHASNTTTYGVSTSSAYGHAMASSTTPKANGTASVGSETAKFARGDHVHPLQTTISGNAGTATKLQTARTISLLGDVTGSGSFDGNANLNITTTVTNSSHQHSASNISGGYLNTHPENGGTVVPFINNDLAFLLKKGGSAVVKFDDVVQNRDISNVFDGTPSYFGGCNLSASGYTSMTIELTLHKTFTWTSTIYVDHGASSWRAKSLKIEVMNTEYANDVWVVKKNDTNISTGNSVVSCTHTPVGASNAGGGFNKVRFTFSDWNILTDCRIAEIGIINYGSCGLQETFISRNGSSIYGHITPFSNNSVNLGSSSSKWANVYATTFTGSLSGNASTATKATQDASGNNIVDTYATKTALNSVSGLVGDVSVSTQINNAIANKADSEHTHDSRYYTESEIDTKLSGKANSSHGNHVPATETANNAKFLRNDNTWQTVTPANIGAAASSHGTHVSYSTSAPLMDGTATAGSASTVARSDHKHPTDTSRASASSVTALQNLVGDTAVSTQISNAILNTLNNHYTKNEITNIVAANNLLDNSDFRHTINQRGKDVTTADEYMIDRWIARIDGINYDYDDTGLTLSSTSTSSVGIYQKLAVGSELNGKTVTAALCTSDGEIIVTTGTLPSSLPTTWTAYSSNTNGKVTIGIVNIGDGLTHSHAVYISRNQNVTSAITIRWVALYEGEYTADNLPPYVSKGEIAERLECQRYYLKTNGHGYGYASSATTVKLAIPMPVVMRIAPTVESGVIFTIRGNGNSYTMPVEAVEGMLNGYLRLSLVSNSVSISTNQALIGYASEFALDAEL